MILARSVNYEMKFSNVIEFFFFSSFGAFICERRSRLTFSGHILESLRSLDYCTIYQKYMPLHTNCSCFLISIVMYCVCVCVTSVFASDFCARCAMNVRRLFKSCFLLFMLALFSAYLFNVDISSVASLKITFLTDSVDESYD